MLGLLPLIAFLALFVFIGNLYTNWGWKQTFIRSAVLCSSFLVVSTEILSLFRVVNRATLFILWIIPILAMVTWLLWSWRLGRFISLPKFSMPKGILHRILGISILLVLLVTALISWIWLPNTWDSLRYHMPRVAHWAQENAVVHYATGIEVQNGIGPFAEYAILHTYILAGGDRWANFVEWFAMFASLVGGALLAEKLDGSKSVRVITAALMVSLPMGIAQATSTMTDYVVAFFVLAAAIEVICIHKGGMKASSFIFLGLSVGMAIGTKPTAYAYLLPFAFYVVILLIRQRNFGRVIRYSVLVVALILLMNSGQMARNIQTYRNPMGANYLIAEQSNQLRTIRGWISNTVRHASLHAGTPWDPVNHILYKGIIKIHLLLDLSMDDPRTTSIGPFMFWAPRLEETFAGNSLHAYLIVLSLLVSLFFYRKFPLRMHIYSLAVIATFLVFSFVFKWQVFSSRYHLPFFVLFIPFSSVVLDKMLPNRVNYVIGFASILLAWPWIFSLQNRSLLEYVESFRSSETRHSVVEFMNLGERKYEEFAPLTDPIEDAGCSRVAVMISGNGREYPIWANLRAPREDLEIEWIVVGNSSGEISGLFLRALCSHLPALPTGMDNLSRSYIGI